MVFEYLRIKYIPMKTLILKDIVKNSSSNEQGMILYNYLQNAFLNKDTLVLYVDSDMSMSSSFLNSSIGLFLDNYGLDSFQETVKFKGSKNQFSRLADYITKYSSLYPV
ncbi:MAG: hypothetical protein COZ16_00365 [Flavobacteriaceae bacterium CG_4_10_14_3_um_filter_31_253]|nr:MAG: hypothetical protein AUK46_07115 [Flavobacteriaceae bacterium CG2_30_31_66]PIX14505.1 MAG: hypothetical protein COZ74_02860 [Flavobacteriaceae bacterium CG_4_8_14_3_um_filter_31_8]PIY16346.1 MAG: hypothetical protein COZ16_00365 [Flavobacteriaceae bacterium CG_4_10_14_3_um_filter_31_253]PIZ12221.1 MAG: hypothetical protein COY55_01040 [Flavobacteriaceae bacterium CG_4_10_14_0_8_um_filter_31_99]